MEERMKSTVLTHLFCRFSPVFEYAGGSCAREPHIINADLVWNCCTQISVYLVSPLYSFLISDRSLSTEVLLDTYTDLYDLVEPHCLLILTAACGGIGTRSHAGVGPSFLSIRGQVDA
jgi:hypothetical protein